MLSMRRSTGSAILTDLILEVFRLNGRLLSAGDALTRPAGQTSARWQVLGALDEQPLTVAEIGRRMGLTRQSVQRTADLLEADGLVSYRSNPAHQRAKLATLTPSGRATLDAITTRQIDWANRIARRLLEADLQQALATIFQVRTAIDASAISAERPAARPRSAGARPRRPSTRRRAT
jgi:DNA-binding MarR family transcriptional regulator